MLLGSHYTANGPFLLDGNVMDSCCQPYAKQTLCLLPRRGGLGWQVLRFWHATG